MSYTNDQWRSAITKLLRMTSMNEIRWEPSQLFDGDAWTTVDRSLMAEIGDKAYVISQTRTRYYHDEESFSWNGGYIFSIFQSNGFNEYERIATAPQLSSISGLFEAAESNMAFNRNALDGLIG